MLPSVPPTTPKIAYAALFRDLTAGLDQQMFFWGRDALHPGGNLFVRTGFQKRPSCGLQGTSCYSRPWQNGTLELHGAHAGWFGPEGGFLFIRPMKRCVRWRNTASPSPGTWPKDHYDPSSNPELHRLALPFLDWWLDYESLVHRIAGPDYRQDCMKRFKQLHRTRPWGPPPAAPRWVAGVRHAPATRPPADKVETSAHPRPRPPSLHSPITRASHSVISS